jgi:galactokinase
MDGVFALLLLHCYRRCAVSPCGFRLTPPGVGGNVVLLVSDDASIVAERFRAEASEIVSLYTHDILNDSLQQW